MRNINQLKKLNLTDKEARAYLACLEIGNGSALSISKKAEMPKSTCYETLVNLSKKGLVKIYPKRGRKYFSAQDPEILVDHIERQQETARKLIPELKSLYLSETNRPRVRFYEGEEGIHITMKEILAEANELLAIISAQDVEADYFKKFVEDRIKRKIPVRAIFRDSDQAGGYKKMDKTSLRTSKIIHTDHPFSSLEYIWQNKTAIITFQKQISVTIIEDSENYKIQKAMFESMWKFHPEK